MIVGETVYVRGNTYRSPDKVGRITGTTVHGWPEVKFDDSYHSIAYPPWRVTPVWRGKAWWWSRSEPAKVEMRE